MRHAVDAILAQFVAEVAASARSAGTNGNGNNARVQRRARRSLRQAGWPARRPTKTSAPCMSGMRWRCCGWGEGAARRSRAISPTCVGSSVGARV